MRATLLSVVDPHAGELQPIRFPLLTWVGLVCWSVGGLLAAAAVWLLRLGDLAALFELPIPSGTRIEDMARIAVPLLLVVAAIGALGFVRPHARTPGWYVVGAAAAVASYLCLAVISYRIHTQLDVRLGVRYFGAASVSVERLVLRLCSDGLLIVAALGLRPTLSLLIARSVLLRSGTVDRQTLTGVAGAVAVAALGDAMRLASRAFSNEAVSELVRLCGTLMVGLGSLLLTIALVLLVVDCIRLRPVIVTRPLSYEDVLGTPGRSPT